MSRLAEGGVAAYSPQMRRSRRNPTLWWVVIGASCVWGSSACLDSIGFIDDGPLSGGGGKSAAGGGGKSAAGGEGQGAAGGSATTSSTSNGVGGSGGSTGVGGGDDGLVDRGLVVRYFLDEAGSGIGVASAVDASGHLDLAHETSDYLYVEPAGHRGLRWTSTGLDGGPFAEVAGTPVATALAGASSVTVELVLRIGDFLNAARGSSIFGINRGSSSQETLEVWGRQNSLRATWNDTLGPTWTLIPLATRSVLHVVFDIRAVNADDRVTVYVDGTEVVTQGALSNGSPLPASLMGRLRIGNDYDGTGSSMEGNVYYAAIYAAALTEQEVAVNFDRLIASDDTEPIAE